MRTPPLRTPLEAKEWLERHGVTATEWARVHGFEPAVVYALLSGRAQGRRGQAHHAAVALGLKRVAPACEAPPLMKTPEPAVASTSDKKLQSGETVTNLPGDAVMS